jgi:dTDP-4-dehydrorhamnose reductase
MIVVLGASGYIGEAFLRTLKQQGHPVKGLSRREIDYTRFDVLLDFLRTAKPVLLINAAGFTGKPNVDACETARAETIIGNVLLPQTIAHACHETNTLWAHISSGCIYTGAKFQSAQGTRIERDLMKPDVRALLEANPQSVRGFTELDPPNFTFRSPPTSFYSGSKALAEEAISPLGGCYVWRLRIPFDEYDQPRNYLTKLQRYPKVYDNVNSVSHRQDFVEACLSLWEKKAPLGIYNITNPGFITARQVVEMIRQKLHINRDFTFWKNDDEFYREAAKTPRSNCVLDVSKLLSAGVKMRPVEEALADALARWVPAREMVPP